MGDLSGIRCRCGHRIRNRDVLQRGYYLSNWEPMYVYLKFRCSNCKMLGEEIVDYGDWDDAVLDEAEAAPRPAREVNRRSSLGPITVAEVQEFGRRVARLRRADVEALRRTTA